MMIIARFREKLKKGLGGRSARTCASLLPWYLNETLSAAERRAMSRWLGQSPGDPGGMPVPARDELTALRQVQRAVGSQPKQIPSPAVWRRVLTKVGSEPPPQTAPVGARLILGTCIVLLCLTLLWTILQPGVLLEWSASGGPLTAFRIYRAPLGSDDYSLVGEIAANPERNRYQYLDARLWPGQVFIYRIDAVGAGGQPAARQALPGSALVALPGQMALLTISLIVGYGVVALDGRWPGFRSPGGWAA